MIRAIVAAVRPISIYLVYIDDIKHIAAIYKTRLHIV